MRNYKSLIRTGLLDNVELKPKGPSEHQIQSAFVRWFRIQYPKLLFVGYSTPNGGLRTKSYGGKLKAEGMVSGVPDFHLAIPNDKYASLYLEFKSEKGRLSTEQRLVIEELMFYRNRVEVVRTTEEARTIIKDYLTTALPPL